MPIKPLTRPYQPAISARKRRYQTDPEFREAMKASARSAYRRGQNVELASCEYSLKFLDEMKKNKRVRLPDGKEADMDIMYLSTASEALQKLYQTVLRWVHNGMIPKPILLTDLAYAKPNLVYHVEEVRIMVSEIGEHEKQFVYYRKDHSEVRIRIEQRILELRQSLGFSENM